MNTNKKKTKEVEDPELIAKKKEEQWIKHREIFQKAYDLMGEDVIEGNCGDLCDCHCCRDNHETGEAMGIYFLPYEYETMQLENDIIDHDRTEKHTSEEYLFTDEIEYLVYSYCKSVLGCHRDLRPIQCRSYPFAPHLDKGVLSLVIEKNQEHDCPLIKMKENWRQEYIDGMYKGWKELLQIKKIAAIVKDDSEVRDIEGNIAYKYTPK